MCSYWSYRVSHPLFWCSWGCLSYWSSLAYDGYSAACYHGTEWRGVNGIILVRPGLRFLGRFVPAPTYCNCVVTWRSEAYLADASVKLQLLFATDKDVDHNDDRRRFDTLFEGSGAACRKHRHSSGPSLT